MEQQKKETCLNLYVNATVQSNIYIQYYTTEPPLTHTRTNLVSRVAKTIYFIRHGRIFVNTSILENNNHKTITPMPPYPMPGNRVPTSYLFYNVTPKFIKDHAQYVTLHITLVHPKESTVPIIINIPHNIKKVKRNQNLNFLFPKSHSFSFFFFFSH